MCTTVHAYIPLHKWLVIAGYLSTKTLFCQAMFSLRKLFNLVFLLFCSYFFPIHTCQSTFLKMFFTQVFYSSCWGKFRALSLFSLSKQWKLYLLFNPCLGRRLDESFLDFSFVCMWKGQSSYFTEKSQRFFFIENPQSLIFSHQRPRRLTMSNR